jgi:hypothetical protein
MKRGYSPQNRIEYAFVILLRKRFDFIEAGSEDCGMFTGVDFAIDYGEVGNDSTLRTVLVDYVLL